MTRKIQCDIPNCSDSDEHYFFGPIEESRGIFDKSQLAPRITLCRAHCFDAKSIAEAFGSRMISADPNDNAILIIHFGDDTCPIAVPGPQYITQAKRGGDAVNQPNLTTEGISP